MLPKWSLQSLLFHYTDYTSSSFVFTPAIGSFGSFVPAYFAYRTQRWQHWHGIPGFFPLVPLPSGVDGKSPNYMEGKIAGKIIEPNGELFHYKVLIVGGHFSSYGIPWNSSSMEFAR